MNTVWLAAKKFTFEWLSQMDVDGNISIDIEAQLRSELTAGLPLLSQDCDYCKRNFGFFETIVVEVVRYNNLPGWYDLDEGYSRWFPARSRCADCETETITPETMGLEEALIDVELTKRDDRWCLRNSDFEILDYSPNNEGYLSPDAVGLVIRSRHRAPNGQVEPILRMEAGRWFVINWKLKRMFPRAVRNEELANQNSPDRYEYGFKPRRDLPPEIIDTVESLIR